MKITKDVQFIQKCKELVYEYAKKHLDVTDNTEFTIDNVYSVWTCKALRNWKGLFSTSLPDGRYYDITYNGNTDEIYFDAYKKFENVCHKL